MSTLAKLTLTDLPDDDRKAVPFRKNRFTLWLSRKLYPLVADENSKLRVRLNVSHGACERITRSAHNIYKENVKLRQIVGQYKAGRNPSQRALKEVGE